MPTQNPTSLPTSGPTCASVYINGQTYGLSCSTTSDTGNFEAICQADFGPGARVADYYWDMKAYLQESDTVDLVSSLSIPQTVHEKYYFVIYKGSKSAGDTNDFPIWNGSQRVWFVENHGDIRSKHKDWFDKFGYLQLGAWYGISGQVICIF